MIVATRLCRLEHAAFDGSGGLYRSGRWHERGYRVVYAAGSEALAALELLVHLSSIMQLPEYACVKVRIPERLILDVRDFGPLPADWASAEAPPGLEHWAPTGLSRKRLPCYASPPSSFLVNRTLCLIQRTQTLLIDLQVPLPFEFDVRLFARLQ